VSTKIKRSFYADMCGPTAGDRVLLADTDLIIEVEKGLSRSYGEEVKIRRRQGDPRRHGDIPGHQQQGASDTYPPMR